MQVKLVLHVPEMPATLCQTKVAKILKNTQDMKDHCHMEETIMYGALQNSDHSLVLSLIVSGRNESFRGKDTLTQFIEFLLNSSSLVGAGGGCSCHRRSWEFHLSVPHSPEDLGGNGRKEGTTDWSHLLLMEPGNSSCASRGGPIAWLGLEFPLIKAETS